MGTPAYMSPEQAAGRLDQLGPASDVYSLGATLYCLLTGKAPFERGDLGGVLQRVQRGDFLRPRQVRRDVPRALEAVCLKAMAVGPRTGITTPKALAEDVAKWLADEPTTAYREPWRVRLGRWVRRRQALAAALAAGLLVAILAGGVGAWQLDRQRAEQRHDVESSLAEVVRLQGEARWAEARAVIDQAQARLSVGGPADLKARLGRMQGELELVQNLDAIRLKRATLVGGHFDHAGADREYAAAFRAAGMPEAGGDAMAAAAWAAGSGRARRRDGGAGRLGVLCAGARPSGLVAASGSLGGPGPVAGPGGATRRCGRTRRPWPGWRERSRRRSSRRSWWLRLPR